jgi:hypothetical protein
VPDQPLCEVFGYLVDNFTPEAIHHRINKLCPYKNDQPCTKDKADDPLGVCSMWEGLVYFYTITFTMKQKTGIIYC